MDDLIRYLSGLVTPERIARFDKVLEFRTRYLTVALEDIYQSQNASAVVRTCDCFGIQDIHIIENSHNFKMDSEVALGAQKWLTVHSYSTGEDNTMAAINQLRSQGYRIVATSPHSRDASLPDFDLHKGRAALFFGTELTGISATLEKNADEFIRIPLFGFTESYNISVAAALVLQDLICRLQASDINWKFTPEEKKQLKLQWLRKSIKDIQFIERQFLKNKN